MRRPFIHYLKRVFSFLALLMSILVFILGMMTAIVFYKPAILWRVAEEYILPPDLSISWRDLYFDGDMKSMKNWIWTWTIDDLAIEKKSPEIALNIRRSELQVEINIFSDKPLVEMTRAVVQADEKGTIKQSCSLVSITEEEQNLYQQLESYFSYLQMAQKYVVVQFVDIQIPQLELETCSTNENPVSPWILGLHLSKTPSSDSDLLQLKLNASQGLLTARLTADVDFALATPVVKSQLSINRGHQLNVKSQLTGTYVADLVTIQGKGEISYLLSAQKKPVQFTPLYELKVSPSAADLLINTSINNIPGVFAKLESVKAKAHLPLSENKMWSEKPLDFNISTGIDLFLVDKDMRKPIEKFCKCRLPEEFQTTLMGQVWLSPLFTAPEEKQKTLDTHLNIESVKNKLFDLNMAAHLVASRDRQKWYFEPQSDLDLTINSFQGLRRYLDAKQIMIPAPLDVLEGKINFVARKQVDIEDHQYKTMATLSLDLASKGQRVLVSTDVRLHLNDIFTKLDVYVDVLIRKLRLELPPIDPILGVPSLAKDARILTARKKRAKREGIKVNIFVEARTEQPKAIELLSRYAKPFVPVTLKISTTGKSSRGDVIIEPFLISYLRREIHVESLKISLPEADEEDMPITGRVRMEQGGYKIFIDLAGALGAPTLRFSSDPYLPRSDIISVLLFGRVNDRLVSGDAETAGRFDAAITDRAIGLAGLWAFATTPIQSFSYNAVTKVYTATVKLGDGLTAGVGTNWERATNVEVRKRLSQRWALTASWIPADADQTHQQGRLVLQWEKRF